MQKDPVFDVLQKAVKGLLYISETEAELEPFLWPEASDSKQADVLKLTGAAPGTAVEEIKLDEFFHTVSKEDRPKFDKLAQTIKGQLSSVKVYKIGDEAEKQVCIVGKTKAGQWAGLKTSIVET